MVFNFFKSLVQLTPAQGTFVTILLIYSKFKMPWKRPQNLPVGRIWHKFQGRNKDGMPGWFQIRDLEPEYKETCLDLMQETFIRDEPLCQVLEIASDPVGVQSIRKNWEEYLEQGISLACFTEVDGQIGELVGFNVIVLRWKGEEDEGLDKLQGKGVRELFKTLLTAESMVDIYEHYGVDKFLSSSGLTVYPNFRGQNIGARMMEARKPLCKALNINVVATVFTAKTSQVLAAKCGYELLASLPYEEMLKQGIDLTECSTKTAELRGIKFNF